MESTKNSKSRTPFQKLYVEKVQRSKGCAMFVNENRCCSAWLMKSLYFKGNIRSIEHAFLDMLFHHSRNCSVQLTLLHGFFHRLLQNSLADKDAKTTSTLTTDTKSFAKPHVVRLAR
ncbi:unnamed protein product [Albugo candida]|uniref:Uncharacterized protein n=1 Tax=Albugo candida TaxID=65357 RepID=A0A024FVR0_9STRA|nr:unnamed protein product [Albugo candida]|eukprot:CCI11116.1 unnamed protein product [Albugo candida]